MAIQIKRGTSSSLSNVVLEDGQLGYATDDNILKIGTGSLTYNNLSPINEYRKYSIVVGNAEAGDTEQDCDFLCYGDGAHNDTLTIQDAINSLSSNGGTVFIRRGTYYLQTQLNIVTANTIIKGEGYSTLLLCKSINLTALYTELESLRIVRYIDTTNTTPTIQIQRSRCHIHHCLFDNMNNTDCSNTSLIVEVISSISDTIISNCTFNELKYSSLIVIKGDNSEISNCLMYNITTNESLIVANGPLKFNYNNITSCTISNNNSIVMFNAPFNNVSNCTFSSNNVAGILINTTESITDIYTSIKGCLFSSNITNTFPLISLNSNMCNLSSCIFRYNNSSIDIALDGNYIVVNGNIFNKTSGSYTVSNSSEHTNIVVTNNASYGKPANLQSVEVNANNMFRA